MFRLLCAAVLLQAFPIFAGSPATGEICDRNGIVLVRYDYSTSEPKRELPFGSLAIHILDRLGPMSKRGPGPGRKLFLTIDARIQSVVEQEMAGVGRGGAVLVDPDDGGILAMASVPSYQLSEIQENFSQLEQDKRMPLLNRVLGSYLPGTALFPVLALAGAAEGKHREKFTCKGGVQHGAKFIKCVSEHGNLSLTEAIKYSCRAFFYHYGNSAGSDAFGRMSGLLGLGKRTSIPLEGEASGRIPSPRWLRDMYYSKREWPEPSVTSMSIGQGSLTVTPPQMAMIAGAFGNGGSLYSIRLIAKTEKGAVVQPSLRTNLLQYVSSESLSMIQQGMLERMRTRGFSQTGNFEMAGICGISNRRDPDVQEIDGFFIGYAPSKKPRVAICLIVQHADEKTTCRLAGMIVRHALTENLPEPLYREPNRGHLDLIESE